jgi:soluble lytic murein transglycosylase
MTFRNLLLLTALLLAGCNLSNQPDITYVIVTSTPAQPPTSTPLPTEPPTPTLQPDVALKLANRSLTNGYYENAVNDFKVVLQQGDAAPSDLRASAAFGLGQAALREGLFQDSVNALTLFISQFSNDARIAQVYFMRGDAYMGLSNWGAAIADFQQYLALRPGLIDSYAHERIGDAQLALGQTDNALVSYGKATDSSRGIVPLFQLREKVAQVYATLKKTSDAVAQYDAILSQAQNKPYRATIDFDAAKALIDGGDLQKGLDRMQEVFNTYQDTTTAYDAMQVLLQNGRSLDDYAQGKVAYLYGDYPKAIDALNRYTTHTQLAAIPAELQLALGRAYREVGNNDAAITAFQTVITQYPKDPLFGEALLEQGRTKFLAGDIPGAIQFYINIADNYGYLPQAAEALWRAGYLYSTNGKPDLGQQVLERLADAYPNTDQARSGLFLAASNAYNAGNKSEAERLYARLATTTTGDDQAAAYLWVGRLALMRGDSQTAQDAFRLCVQAAPESYFSARAQDIVAGRDPFQSPPRDQFDFDDVTQLNDAENWLRKTFNIQQQGYLWPLSSTLENDPRLVRGHELWALGATDEARDELDDLVSSYKKDGLASYQLAIFLRGIGEYSASIQAAANVITAAGVATLDAPAYIARMRYPAYYRDVVLDTAQRRGIDPLLLFSLIRHESLFDTYATGGAGEKGLTQVIPSTAEYIAQQLQWPNYQHSVLYRPYAGIEFGAYYLSQQLKSFDHNVPAALAGYNAGPGRAASWLDVSGSDPDLFMTNITIDSTRLYVERIYSFYTIYRTLYGAK